VSWCLSRFGRPIRRADPRAQVRDSEFSLYDSPVSVVSCEQILYRLVKGLNGGVRDSGVFRGGGTVRWPPLWPDHENFLQATLYKKVRFLPFSSNNCKIQQCLIVFCVSKFQKNGRICGFHWTFKSKKCFSFRGLCPLTPRPGALPLDPAGGSAPRPPL